MRCSGILVSFLSLAAWHPVQAVDSLVDLGYTKVQGVAESGGATRWLGVRYAAPPVGALRFAAPIDPEPTNGTVEDGSNFRPICLPRAASDFTNQPNKRFTVAEDCLFVNIFAPTNATATSKLGVMLQLQGGGFQSNSNANFNGSDLAAFGNIIVAQINYRVGPFGFLQSKEVKEGASLNNGLKDMIQAAKWLKQHVDKFGGDPDQIVAVGDSAGATAVQLLLAAWADEDPKTAMIKGAILESTSVATIRTIEQGQEQYACLLNATGCTTATDTLACLRAANSSALQADPCQFNPGFDDDLIKSPSLARFDQGLYLKVPTIVGTCAEEGTKSVPKGINTTAEALTFFNSQAFGALSNASLALLDKAYLQKQQPDFTGAVDANGKSVGAGPLWRQMSVGFGDFREHCITARVQNAQARDGVRTYNYRFAVRDEEQERLGFGSYHTVELNAVFGPNNTDGAPPKSYAAENKAIVPITMAYWASFVRSLDPNKFRLAGSPEWKPWTGPDARERLRFDTADMGMEVMSAEQRGNCEMVDMMLPAIETPLSSGVVVELNAPGVSCGTSWALSGSSASSCAPGGGGGGGGGAASIKSVSSSGLTTPVSSVASSANTAVSVLTGLPVILFPSTLSTLSIIILSSSSAAIPASTTSGSTQTVPAGSSTSTTSGPAETTNTPGAPEATTSAGSSSTSSAVAAPTTTSPITSRAFPADVVDTLRDSSFSKLQSFSRNNVSSGGCTLENAAIRHEWSDLSVPQREEYIAAVRCIMTKPTKLSASEAPGARSRYDDFLVAHIQQTPNIHSTANFLAWHRYYTWGFEQALRNECGYTGYQPYWNWDRYAKDPENSPLFNGNASSLGGNSPRPGACVETGPFADIKVNLGPGNSLEFNPRCLTRDISKSNATHTTADKTFALITSSNDIRSFQDTMQVALGVHAMGHFTVGGDPGGDIFTSAGDIYFYVHHAMVDRVYWIWQMQDLENRLNAVGGDTSAGLPGSRDDMVNIGVNGGDVKLGSLLNTLGGKGGEFCYIYL
ncbi:para-nitrobenzyl esterase [Gaeumannomyces tritici R3-111a-1]|uniref:Para-nitrobenzyl esterase n=1 Tax=Gaeumannomyces tritici (strain R3-111a-1) TaxID=644352 RepID=J3NPS5_GAET3|nr:para-nitrobenzyl esterase [Gaeumannomyces tritici R3-111a-1]EJT78180.1 para-nitrobenzyl esterase [Gaeumannomyces tritici R3-111a-1]